MQQKAPETPKSDKNVQQQQQQTMMPQMLMPGILPPEVFFPNPFTPNPQYAFPPEMLYSFQQQQQQQQQRYSMPPQNTEGNKYYLYIESNRYR